MPTNGRGRQNSHTLQDIANSLQFESKETVVFLSFYDVWKGMLCKEHMERRRRGEACCTCHNMIELLRESRTYVSENL